MKRYKDLPKELPVPSYLDEKVLGAASRFLVRRRLRRRAIWSVASAAAALLISSAVFFPLHRESVARAEGTELSEIIELAELSDWSALDESGFVLISELNDFFPDGGEMFL